MLHCVLTFFLAHDVFLFCFVLFYFFFMIGGDTLIGICFLFQIAF